ASPDLKTGAPTRTLTPPLIKGSRLVIMTPKITSFVAGCGCACKPLAGQLESAISGLMGYDDQHVIVGLEHGCDGYAIRINGDTAVISTADFFTPMLDDPYDWGRVAAANAIPDVYAMGGTPITAINLVGWPVDLLGLDVLREVLRGGMDVCNEAGISVTGGH